MKFVCILAFCALASAQIQEWPAQPQPIPEIDNLEWPAQPNPRPHPRPEHNDPEQHPEWQQPQQPEWPQQPQPGWPQQPPQPDNVIPLVNEEEPQPLWHQPPRWQDQPPRWPQQPEQPPQWQEWPDQPVHLPEWQEPQPPQWNPNAPQWRADERPTRDQRCEPAHSRNSIVFAHDFDCSLFHECRDGLRFTFQCQGNFLFDRVTMTCRHPRSARC
ncbi:CLUMA_CG000508, isoform B [Clunio marinus]|uniref:CLUMA_CG000508, isoform B n=1 Tax=Clunio marinus TaxID=568069 RepID=A0A1J1HKA2_9DIPT|nr:CLUMA_CG000508, isoform B [Clunio marinus]